MLADGPAAGLFGEQEFVAVFVGNGHGQHPAKGFRQRYLALLVAFADDSNRAGHAIDYPNVGHFQAQGLANAQAEFLD